MSIVADSIRVELDKAIDQSKKYIDLIKASKTNAKSDFFIRKLKKNNKIVANLAIGLDKIAKKNQNPSHNE